jgi:4-hydroxybenzoate polyprenyltransferase
MHDLDAPLKDARPADADRRNWVDRFAPVAARPYLRLARADRPIGVWLLLIPCWQGLTIALISGSPWRAAIAPVVLFAIGAFVMRGAGCAYNDIVDRDFDARVARTALRPIPARQISVRNAIIFALLLSAIGLIVLLQFNPYTIILGFSSLILVAAYPFMKRITWWPQAWLGLTFNWGALVGYSALAGGIEAQAIALYCAGIAWTLGYDTIYACQDKEDDALIGVRSSALRLKEATRPAVAAFYAIATALLAAAITLSGAPAWTLIGLVPVAAHFAWQTARLDANDPERCLLLFKSNRDAGLLALAAMLFAFFATAAQISAPTQP